MSYAYAIVIINGKREVIKTKKYLSIQEDKPARDELEKDLRNAKIKYAFIYTSDHPPTTADIRKNEKMLAALGFAISRLSFPKEMWFYSDSYCIDNPSHHPYNYRFVKITKIIGKPIVNKFTYPNYQHTDWIFGHREIVQNAEADLYGFKMVSRSNNPKLGYTSYYMPTALPTNQKTRTVKGKIVITADRKAYFYAYFSPCDVEILKLWDMKNPIAVKEYVTFD